jgi:hypothetical protein
LYPIPALQLAMGHRAFAVEARVPFYLRKATEPGKWA